MVLVVVFHGLSCFSSVFLWFFQGFSFECNQQPWQAVLFPQKAHICLLDRHLDLSMTIVLVCKMLYEFDIHGRTIDFPFQ